MQTQPHRQLVDLGGPAFQQRKDDTILDLQEMADIAESFVLQRLRTDIPLDDLLALRAAESLTEAQRERFEFALPAEDRNPALDGQRARHSTPDYELRYRDVKFSINGILNRTSVAGWTNIVIAAVRDWKVKLEMEQGGDWHPVAFSLQKDRREYASTRERRPEDPSLLSKSPRAVKAAMVLGVEDTKLYPVRKHHPVLWLCVVWTDLTQGNIDDVWADRTGQVGKGAVAKYADQLQLRFLSAKLGQERKKAIELLTEFYAVEPEEEAPGPEKTTDDLVEPKTLSVKEIVMAKLLHDNGSSWGELGALFGVHHKTIRAAVKRSEKEADPPAHTVEVPEPKLEG